MFEEAFTNLGKAVDVIIANAVSAFNNLAYEMTVDNLQRHQIKKWVDTLETRGYVYDDFAILLVYNESCPEKSYFLKQPL